MTVATFDTCAAAKALREAGFDEAQAKAAVAMVRDAVTEGGAAKADLAGLETRLTVRSTVGCSRRSPPWSRS